MAWPYYDATTGDAGAAAVLQSAASASGLDVSGLGQLGQLQLCVANLLRSDPTTVAVPAGDVSSGTFGANIPDTGTYKFPTALQIGTAAGSVGILSSYTASGADAAAGNVTVKGPVSTGSATAGTIIFQTTSAGGSSSTPQTLATVLTLGSASAAVVGALTFTTKLSSITALATPSALVATAFNAFASTVSGAALMGFGTTNDVALMNRAGTVVLGVGPNTTTVNMVGAATVAGMLTVTGTVTAAASIADGTSLTLTPTAAVNGDVLTILKLSMAAGTPGAFTGLVRQGLSIPAFTVVGDTTPGNPVGINVGIITGTGASVATALQLAPPTGATTNYLIAHTTAATFNVTGAGALTLAGNIGINTAAVGTASLTIASTALTGTSQYGINNTPTLSAAATAAGYGTYTSITTFAGSNTTTNLYGHYIATPTKGAGSTITNRYGLYLESVTGGATINYGIYVAGGTPAIYSAAGGIRADGTFIGFGVAPSTSKLITVSATLSGATSQYGLDLGTGSNLIFGSGATTAGYGAYIGPTTAAASFTMTNFYGAYIDAVAKGASSAITNRYGLYVVGPADGATLNVSAALHQGIAVPATAGAIAAGTPLMLYSGLITIEATSNAPTHVRPVGSICINTGGNSIATRLYINTNGSTTWTNFVTAA